MTEQLKATGPLESTGQVSTPQTEQGVTHADLADSFLRIRGFTGPEGLRLRRFRGDWFRFDGMVFRPLSDEELRSDVMNFLRSTSAWAKATSFFLNSTLAHLQSICCFPNAVEWPARQSEAGWMTQQNCVVMQNGVLNVAVLQSGTSKPVLSPHTPALLSRIALPYPYDPNAVCPRWRQFLNEILPDPDSRHPLQEIFGYCLTIDTRMQRFFLFEGSGANGKGVTLNMIRHLVGPENVSALPLDRFHTAHELIVTLGKLVNITNESGDWFAEEPLKQFVAGDLMHFNPKHKEPFSAKPTAKLVNATNVRPTIRDRSEGFWRRVLILPFPVTIPEGQRKPDLEDTLLEELSGLLNWSIAGAHTLNQRGRFLEPQMSVTARQAWRHDTNPAEQFLEEHYETASDGEIGKQEMYNAFKSFCAANGYKPLNAAQFNQEVIRKFPGATECRPRLQGNSRPRAYRGVTAKSGQGAQVGG